MQNLRLDLINEILAAKEMYLSKALYKKRKMDTSNK